MLNAAALTQCPPVVYWLVFFSIVIHGLSIPVLNAIYKWLQVPIIRDHPVEIQLLSENEPIPNNSVVNQQARHVTVNNRFSCISGLTGGLGLDDPPQAQSDMITMILRSSGQYKYPHSLAGSSTKGLSHQDEQVSAREVV